MKKAGKAVLMGAVGLVLTVCVIVVTVLSPYLAANAFIDAVKNSIRWWGTDYKLEDFENGEPTYTDILDIGIRAEINQISRNLKGGAGDFDERKEELLSYFDEVYADTVMDMTTRFAGTAVTVNGSSGASTYGGIVTNLDYYKVDDKQKILDQLHTGSESSADISIYLQQVADEYIGKGKYSGSDVKNNRATLRDEVFKNTAAWLNATAKSARNRFVKEEDRKELTDGTLEEVATKENNPLLYMSRSSIPDESISVVQEYVKTRGLQMAKYLATGELGSYSQINAYAEDHRGAFVSLEVADPNLMPPIEYDVETMTDLPTIIPLGACYDEYGNLLGTTWDSDLDVSSFYVYKDSGGRNHILHAGISYSSDNRTDPDKRYGYGSYTSKTNAGRNPSEFSKQKRFDIQSREDFQDIIANDGYLYKSIKKEFSYKKTEFLDNAKKKIRDNSGLYDEQNRRETVIQNAANLRDAEKDAAQVNYQNRLNQIPQEADQESGLTESRNIYAQAQENNRLAKEQLDIARDRMDSHTQKVWGEAQGKKLGQARQKQTQQQQAISASVLDKKNYTYIYNELPNLGEVYAIYKDNSDPQNFFYNEQQYLNWKQAMETWLDLNNPNTQMAIKGITLDSFAEAYYEVWKLERAYEDYLQYINVDYPAFQESLRIKNQASNEMRTAKGDVMEAEREYDRLVKEKTQKAERDYTKACEDADRKYNETKDRTENEKFTIHLNAVINWCNVPNSSAIGKNVRTGGLVDYLNRYTETLDVKGQYSHLKNVEVRYRKFDVNNSSICREVDFHSSYGGRTYHNALLCFRIVFHADKLYQVIASPNNRYNFSSDYEAVPVIADSEMLILNAHEMMQAQEEAAKKLEQMQESDGDEDEIEGDGIDPDDEFLDGMTYKEALTNKTFTKPEVNHRMLFEVKTKGGG